MFDAIMSLVLVLSTLLPVPQPPVKVDPPAVERPAATEITPAVTADPTEVPGVTSTDRAFHCVPSTCSANSCTSDCGGGFIVISPRTPDTPSPLTEP